MAASDMRFFPDDHSKACGLPQSELPFCQQYVVSTEPPKSWALDPPKAYPKTPEKSNYQDEEVSITHTAKRDNLELHGFYESTGSVRPVSVTSVNNEAFESSPCSTYRADYIEYPVFLSNTPVPEDISYHHGFFSPSRPEIREPVWHRQAFEYPVATESSYYMNEHKPPTAFRNPALPIDCSECQALCGVHDVPESIYTTDFVPHEILPSSSFCQSSFSVKQATEPMENKSCYRLDYPPRSDEPRGSMKPKEVYIPSLEKLASDTSYQIDFPVRGRSVATKPFHPTCNHWFPTGGRTGVSDYKEEFISRPVEKVISMKPQQVYIPPDKRMDDATVYRSDYGHKTADQQQSFAPKIQYHPPSGPFVGTTTYTEDFQKRHGERSRTCRPIEQYNKPTQKMTDITCYMNDFRAFSCDRAVPCQFHPEYVPPFGRFVDETTYKTDFTKKVFEKSEKYIPKDNLVVKCAAKLNRLSTYQSEFVPFHFGQKHKKHSNSSKPLQNTDRHTTYKIGYTDTSAERTPSFYPKHDFLHSSGRLAGSTAHQASKNNREQPVLARDDCCLSKGCMNSSTSYMTNFLPPSNDAISHEAQPGTLRPATTIDGVRGLQATHTRGRNRSLSENSRGYSALKEIERHASVLETKKVGQSHCPLTCGKCHNPVVRRLEMTKGEV
ncbi:hypothetical protein CRM22_001650 [Opisthorchis felineus]|uniref:Stabilizer of axonemal microtubules 2 n=1 Tax=Opisthorchis felineus TaxID=147828 RepID=A0A4S2M9R0_OPIFE|nr:hypothetical protein CRM22_001650 [Opisthorchis felineus]TGZ73233.1 hypothetical protein CRM22_001650 [Opisthorchis felineus]